MKSTTCKGSNGQYLEEYHSEASASFAVKEIKKDFGHDLTPYLCRTCDYWHLKALSTSKLCTFCTDSALFQKDLYATREDADIMARYVSKEKRIKLFPYKCPYTSGWHLTKKNPGR